MIVINDIKYFEFMLTQEEYELIIDMMDQACYEASESCFAEPYNKYSSVRSRFVDQKEEQE